jgi:lysophospholipase L1-like esterase
MKIVCLGDSLTYGFGVPRRDTWVSLTAERTKMELVNRGINGDTTGGMLARFWYEMTKHSPDSVLLMGGGNDIFISGTAVSAKANISAMVHQAAALGIAPLIGTLLPGNSAGNSPGNSANVRHDWASLSNVAHAREVGEEYSQWLILFAGVFGVPVVDFRAAFKSVSDPERNRALYIDGMHPTAEGHRLMADVLSRKIQGPGATPPPVP